MTRDSFVHSVDYNKKKEKKAQIKFIKDETVPRNDTYKSHTVHVPSGESPSSQSRPMPTKKEGVVRPITQGKLLRKGGPSAVSRYVRSLVRLLIISFQKPAASRPKPASQPLPGKTTVAPTPKPPVAAAVATAASTKSTAAPRAPPPPPSRNHAPPPPPPEPDVEMYKAKFAFEGQEGEMTLKKDDIVELVEKDNNGWWLVKMGGKEGWAPNNYLELIPPKPKAAAAPPPPPPPPPPAPAAKRPTPAAPAAPAAPKVGGFKSISADPHAKPVAVFPGMAAGNGSAAPWKRMASTVDSSNDSTPAASRPASAAAPKPPLAAKPKPPPPVAAKPSVGAPPKVGAKPPVPTAPRPGAGAPKPRVGGAAKPPSVGGQMDLAAAVSRLYFSAHFFEDGVKIAHRSSPSAHNVSQRTSERTGTQVE